MRKTILLCVLLAGGSICTAGVNPKNEVFSSVQQKQENPVRNKQIQGTVLDEKNEPIIGATVLIKKTVTGVLTDINGKYHIQAAVGDVLEFSFVGYKSVEKTVKAEGTINVVMTESNINLDDVVVIGYGQQKKESVVASVNTVKAAELRMPTRSLTNMIAGQVAGVIAVQRSGEPGNDEASFWIRGQSSYAGGTNPLVLVDGVPRSMSDIDVDEIESFTVLKDAAATAVYGSEGANGVVLITSKRGQVQKTQVNFNAQFSIASPTRMIDLMPSYDYLDMYNEAAWNDAGNPGNFTAPYSAEELAKYRSGEDPDLYPNSIWTDLLSKNTYNQRYTINIRGGSDKVRYFASGAYYSEEGIFKSNPIEDYDANIGLKRYNIRSNVDVDLTSTTKMSLDLSGQYRTKNSPGYSTDNIFNHIVSVPTHRIPFQWSDGTAAIMQKNGWGTYNPYNMLNHSGYSKEWYAFLQTKLMLEQKLDFITKGLSIKGMLSFDADFSSSMSRSKNVDSYYVTGRDENGELIKTRLVEGSALSDPALSSTGGTKKIYIEASLNYKRTFNNVHDVTGVLVYNQKETQYANSSGSGLLPYRKQNFVARGTYGYDNRYMAELSFGATGSENFMSGHRWGIFPAIGLAWYISHEKFMKPLERVISTLKLRASYGITGNDEIGNSTRFPYREVLNEGGGVYNLGLLPGVNGYATNNYGYSIYESTFAAPNLSWEKEKKTNVGIDMGLFDGRIVLSADYFFNKRQDILINRKIVPQYNGFRVNPYQNFGITHNKGVDANITLKQQLGDLTLSARGNFTYAKNEIVEYDETMQELRYQMVTGQSINVPFLFVDDGLYTPDDFNITTNNDGSHSYALKKGIPAYTQNVMPGDIKYKDLNGDGTITALDKTWYSGLYAEDPQIVYGFGLNAEYKGFFAGVFFQGNAHSSVNISSNSGGFIPFYNGRDLSSARVEARSHWRADDPYNQNVIYPRLRTENNFENNQLPSTWWYRSGDYLRLKNVEFGYQFDKRLTQRIKVQNLRIYVQGTNLAVWDDIKMWDPELGSANSGATYPLNRTWTIGAEITF